MTIAYFFAPLRPLFMRVQKGCCKNRYPVERDVYTLFICISKHLPSGERKNRYPVERDVT